MERYEVESSNISEIGYNTVTRELEVKFKSGKLYCYKDVPNDVYQSFWNAKSKGKYFHEMVRDKYEFTEVVELPDQNKEVKHEDMIAIVSQVADLTKYVIELNEKLDKHIENRIYHKV